MMASREEVKALLARSGVEINNALHRVDSMSPAELEEVVGMDNQLRAAFFDKNGSCGVANAADLVAFFDKNGSCSSKANLAVAFDNVLRRR